MLRFAGYELDQRRAELRGPDGAPVRLRAKSLRMLHVLAANPGRVVSKHELMEEVWPNIHVGEDSLFQCIREIRAALGDEERRLIRVVSGRGYLFEAAVSGVPGDLATPAEPASASAAGGGEEGAKPAMAPDAPLLPSGLRGPMAVVAAAGLAAVIGLAVAATMLAPTLLPGSDRPAIMVMPIVAKGGDSRDAAMAAGVTDSLLGGLSGIDGVRVIAPPPGAADASGRGPARSDFVLAGELERSRNSWTLQARIVGASNGEVKAVAEVSVDAEGIEEKLQQSRLAAGVGEPLARGLNVMLESTAAPAGAGKADAAGARVVIQQAMASINQTSPERFAAAQLMLERALVADPANVELQVALAGLQTRGIQMLWYDPAEGALVESTARSLLEGALRIQPRSVTVLEAYCRFLTATNNFVESLVACARVLSFDPWNGSALYQLGLTQLNLGRFDDALASFRQADRFDTPEVSRWTWLLGMGWAHLLLGHEQEAVEWLRKSIAITPASGRPYLLLAVAYQRLGRTEEAKAAMTKAIALRPGSTALNVASPTRNSSPAFVEASGQMIAIMVEVGLPER